MEPEGLDLESRVLDLLGRQLDKFFAEVHQAVLPNDLIVEFRHLVDVQPFVVFTIAFNFLDERIQQWGPTPPPLDSPVALTYTQEVERWNVPGLAYLRPEFAPLATDLYERLLLHARGVQHVINARLHKGTPYHMLGWAKLLQDDRDEARDYFVLAAFEDALIDSEGWRGAPAATTLNAHWSESAEIERVTLLVNCADQCDEDQQRILVWNPELLLMLRPGI